MLVPRVIPVLLLEGRGLVKTRRFREPTYVGDPINALKIFNEKEVDELILLCISATPAGEAPPLELIAEVVGECFMPLCYGGGVRDLKTIERILALGVEKIALNTAAAENPALVEAAAKTFGSQSTVVSIDVRRTLLGRQEVCVRRATVGLGEDPVRYARRMEELGAGEVLLTSVERDGCRTGYDLSLVERVSSAVKIPVIASGGAASVSDLARVVREAGASAAGAGSLFVLQGKHRAVLITYPERTVLEEAFAP